MDDAPLVSGFERLRNLNRNGKRLRDGDGALRQSVGQCRAVDELHDERGHIAGFLQTVNRRDVRMVERGQDPRFAPKSSQPLGVAGYGLEQKLDRDVAIERAIAGAVDLAHSAFAKLLQDAIRAEVIAGLHRVLRSLGFGETSP